MKKLTTVFIVFIISLAAFGENLFNSDAQNQYEEISTRASVLFELSDEEIKDLARTHKNEVDDMNFKQFKGLSKVVASYIKEDDSNICYRNKIWTGAETNGFGNNSYFMSEIYTCVSK